MISLREASEVLNARIQKARQEMALHSVKDCVDVTVDEIRDE